MRTNYIFRCKRCGSGYLMQHSTNIACDERLTITDYGSGPEIEIMDEDYYHDNANYTFLCGDCGLELPVNSDDELIEYIIANHKEIKETEEENE